MVLFIIFLVFYTTLPIIYLELLDRNKLNDKGLFALLDFVMWGYLIGTYSVVVIYAFSKTVG